MAIALVAGSPAGAVLNGSAAFVEFSVATGAGTNRFLICGQSCGNSSDQTSDVKFNGVSLAPHITFQGYGNKWLRLWGMVNPPSGTFTLRADFTAASVANVAAMVFTGVDQTTPVIHTGGASNSFQASPYSNGITSVAGGMALDAFIANQGDNTPDATQTHLIAQNDGFNTSLGMSMKLEAVAMAWAFAGSGAAHCIAMLNPAEAPPPAVTRKWSVDCDTNGVAGRFSIFDTDNFTVLDSALTTSAAGKIKIACDDQNTPLNTKRYCHFYAVAGGQLDTSIVAATGVATCIEE